jgi:hypothetical protein
MPNVFYQYYCEKCDYKCSNKSNFNKHFLSKKHESILKKCRKLLHTFQCEICNFICNKESNYIIHLNTQKHISNTTELSRLHCQCGKHYKNKRTLNFHKKTCMLYASANANASATVNTSASASATVNTSASASATVNTNALIPVVSSTELVLETNTENTDINCLEKQKNITEKPNMMNMMIEEIKHMMVENKEFKNMLAEQNKIIQEMANNNYMTVNHNNNTINNVNKQFNLNMFLNETCKDAMDLSDFIENIHVSMEDMEKTGELGFAKGMSRIIMNNLNAIDVCKRPIHCSDVKRETLYIKNNGVWEKETEEKKRTKEIIYKVSCLNSRQLLKWRDLARNKGYDNSEHAKNDEFMKLVMEVNKLRDEEIDKVITNISKHVAIDKDKVKMSGYLHP